MSFLRPQENGRTPDRIMARLKSPFPYGRGIKSKFRTWQSIAMAIACIRTAVKAYSSSASPFKSARCIKASFHIPENRPNFPTTKGFRTKISKKLVCQYMTIFFNFSLTSNHLHPLQVENCDSNSRLVVDEDDNGKFRLERVNQCWLKFGPTSQMCNTLSGHGVNQQIDMTTQRLYILHNTLAQCCLNVGNVSETGSRKTFTAHTKRSPNVDSLSEISAQPYIDI